MLGATSAAGADYPVKDVLDHAKASCAAIGLAGSAAPEGWTRPKGANVKLAKAFAKERTKAFEGHPLFRPETLSFETSRSGRSLLMLVTHLKSGDNVVLTNCTIRDLAAPQGEWESRFQEWAGREGSNEVRFMTAPGATYDPEAEREQRKALPLRLSWKPGLNEGSEETEIAFWHGKDTTDKGVTPGLTYSDNFTTLR